MPRVRTSHDSEWGQRTMSKRKYKHKYNCRLAEIDIRQLFAAQTDLRKRLEAGR